MNPKLWPNLLSGLRLALMPVMLGVAWAGLRPWFIGLAAVSLATDALDGFLARRLNAFSDFGRKLDSIADYLTMMTGLAGIALLWPEIVQRELPWLALGLGAFVGSIGFGLIRLGRAPFYHTWATKAGVIGCALSLIPLLAGRGAAPFHAMIMLLVLVAAEDIAISVILPSHVGEMPSAWHAWRARQERQRLTLAASHPSRTTEPVK